MKPKNYISVIATIFSIVFSFFLVSCFGSGDVVEIKMADENTVEFKAGEFSYDGIKVVLIYSNGNTKEANLNETMISEADKLNFFKMGEHSITVMYTSKITTTMKINVVRHEFDDIYRLDGYTCVYDGKPHSVEVSYELPEGTSVEYPYGNTFTNAGEYNVEAIISKAGYVSKKLSTKLIIEKAQIDISSVKYTDKSVVYDGEIKTIEAVDVPQGVKVEYEVWNEDKTVRLNNAINIGTYTMVAKFGNSDENYDQTQTKEAKLTITKAKYDMSNVKMDDAEKTYDGNEFQARLTDSSVLPEDVTVTYKYYNAEGKEVTSTIDAGEYKIVASFTGKNSNYEEIAPIEAKLKVNKRQLSLDGKITFNSATFNFDRQMHKLEAIGKLPEDIEVTYENNEKIEAGEYRVIARFTDKNPNEEIDITELEAYLIINQIVEVPQVIDSDTGKQRDFESKDLKMTIDPATGNKTIDIPNLLPDKYEITSIKYTDKDGKYVSVNKFCDNITYNYRIVFKFIDPIEQSSVTMPPVSGTVKYDIKFEDDLKLEDKTLVYDGKAHGLSINKELPVGTTVNYPSGEEFTDVGTYQITWELNKETYAKKTLVGNLKITQAEYDMKDVILEDVTMVYDGTNYTPEKPESTHYNTVFDKLPAGVTVKQVLSKIKVGEEWQDYGDSLQGKYPDIKGEYKITIIYDYDAKNYKPVQNMEYNLTINPIIINLDAIKFNDKTIDAGSVTNVGVAWMGIDDVPFEYQGTDTAKIILRRSENLPEIIGVIYDYKDSNNNIIFTMDTSSKNIYYVSGDYPKKLGYEPTNGGTDVWCDFELLNTAGTYNVTARFVLDSNYDPTNYKLSVEELNATLTVKP